MKKWLILLLLIAGCQSPVTDANRQEIRVIYQIITPASFIPGTLTPDAGFDIELWYNKGTERMNDLSLPHIDTLLVGEESLGSIVIFPLDSLSANIRVYVGDSLVTNNYLDRFPERSSHHFWVTDY